MPISYGIQKRFYFFGGQPSFAVTVAAGDAILVGVLNNNASGGNTVSAVSHNGVSLTQLSATAQLSTNVSGEGLTVFGLGNLSASSGSVVITATEYNTIACVVVILSGATASPFGTASSGTPDINAITNPSQSCTSVSGDEVIGFLALSPDPGFAVRNSTLTLTPGSGETLRSHAVETDPPNSGTNVLPSLAAFSKTASGTSTTIAPTISAARGYRMVAIAVTPSGGGGSAAALLVGRPRTRYGY